MVIVRFPVYSRLYRLRVTGAWFSINVPKLAHLDGRLQQQGNRWAG